MSAKNSMRTSFSDAIEKYISLVMQWSKVHNLMSSGMGEKDIAEHVEDCLVGSSIFDNLKFETVVDIGSGAGFPGVLLALKFPNKSIVMIDSVRKKTVFLSAVRGCLKLSSVSVVNSRIENIDESIFGENVFLSTRAAFSVDNIDILVGPIKKCAGIMMWTTPQGSSALEKKFSSFAIHPHAVWDYVLSGSQKARRVVWFKG